MRLIVPSQIVELDLVATDRWLGSIKIDGEDFRIEVYGADTTDETTSQLIDDLFVFADCGGPLRRHTLPDGTQGYLAVMPKGGTC